MSYNIDSWRTKELRDLRVPLAAFYKHPRSDWHPERNANADGTLELVGLEGSSITGTVQDDMLHVTDLECHGEGSGTFMNWILEPALKESKGRLVASCVWEGGDTINRLIVDDGVVTWQDIEI